MNACEYCGKEGPLQRDHVVPRSRGGPDNATNIAMACGSCNASKGDRTASEWLEERCPASILKIEKATLKRLESKLRKRRERKVPIYVAHKMANGGFDWVGEVFQMDETSMKVMLVDNRFAERGHWITRHSFQTLPTAECEIFTTSADCLRRALDANAATNSRISPSPERVREEEVSRRHFHSVIDTPISLEELKAYDLHFLKTCADIGAAEIFAARLIREILHHREAKSGDSNAH